MTIIIWYLYKTYLWQLLVIWLRRSEKITTSVDTGWWSSQRRWLLLAWKLRSTSSKNRGIFSIEMATTQSSTSYTSFCSWIWVFWWFHQEVCFIGWRPGIIITFIHRLKWSWNIDYDIFDYLRIELTMYNNCKLDICLITCLFFLRQWSW